MEWVIINLIESFLLTWFVTSILDIKSHKIWIYRIFMISMNFTIITISNYSNFYDILLTSLLIILNSIISYYFTYNKINEIVLVLCIESVFNALVIILTVFINEIFDLKQYFDLITKIFYLVLGKMFLSYFNKNKVFFNDFPCNRLSILLFSFHFVLQHILQIYLILKTNIPEVHITFIMLFACSIGMFWVMQYILKSNYVNSEYEKLKQKYQNEQALLHIYDQLKMAKHDLKHDYQLIAYYLNQKDYQKIKELISNRKDVLASIPVFVKTKNELINVIINNKIMSADMKQIKVECLINVSQKLPIQDYIFNCLLSNILDNAIENCHENGLIEIHILYDEPILYIQVINDVDSSFNQTLKTKKDKQKHGYGLKSVCKIVHQYHGEMDIQYDDKKFIIQLSLILQ